MKEIVTQEDILKVLDGIYEKTIDGLPRISKPIDELVSDYTNKYDDIEVAAKKMLSNQIKKCTVSGFLTGVGGAISLPVSVSADISSVLYVQMRMIAAAAKMGGYDLKNDEVQTLVYACLAGVSVGNVFKKAGIDVGKKLAVGAIKKIPGDVVIKINQKVGFRFLTKFGEKGVVNLGKLVPGVGGFVGGGLDFAETNMIAKRAYNMFIQGEIE